MAAKKSPIETVKATDARQHWSQLLNDVFKERKRVVVEKSGVPVAAIISARDLERLQRLEEERAADFAVIDEIREAFKDVPEDVLEQQINEAVAQARAEIRQERKRSRSRKK